MGIVSPPKQPYRHQILVPNITIAKAVSSYAASPALALYGGCSGYSSIDVAGPDQAEEERLNRAITRTARALILPAALVATVALLGHGCGGGDNDNVGGGEDSLNVSMGDNFFEPNEFTVKTGQKVTINLTNEGAAVHNMRIAGADNEYNTEDDALSEPGQLTPGGTGKLVWTAPDKAGVIDLKCDFHPTDSVGTIKVE